MRRPKIDPGSHYSLTEAARATGIPRGVLDHGCRSGRLPFRQTESGTRLLSGPAVLQLARDRDLRSFPKAYEPSPGPAPNLGYEEEQTPQGRPAAPTAAERMGLLDKPTPQMVQAKERAEQAQLGAQADRAYLESQRARMELNQLREEQEDRQRARHAEAQAARKAEAEQQRAAPSSWPRS